MIRFKQLKKKYYEERYRDHGIQSPKHKLLKEIYNLLRDPRGQQPEKGRGDGI